MAFAGAGELPASEATGRWLTPMAAGLALAAAAAPIAVALAAGANALLWPPLVASALVALLVAAPAGAGLAAVLIGTRRLVALAEQAGGDGEHAALRVGAATLLFGYALLLPALGPDDRGARDCVPITAAELVSAWTLLFCVMLWPITPAVRRLPAIVLDLSLFSAFLHCGGREVAGWYPLYVIVTFYAGLRYGVAALLTAAAASVVGFAAVVASTESWRAQPALCAGLLLALFLLPALLLMTLRRAAAARSAAARAEANRQDALLAIAQSLRRPAVHDDAGSARAAPIDDILDFAALETGTFLPPLVTFDLRALIRQTLAPLQGEAAGRRVILRWRVDPRLPNRLRGQAEALTRILRVLAEHATTATRTRVARLAVETGHREPDRVRLDLRLDGAEEPRLGLDGKPLAVALLQRLAALAGGTFMTEPLGDRQSRLCVSLPLAVEPDLADPVLDLDRRPVLIVCEDEALAGFLAEPLANWNAEPRWPADADQAIAELALADDGRRAVVIIDGRGKLMAALGVAHQAAKLGDGAPFVLLIVEDGQIAGLMAMDDGELDGVIPAPPTAMLLANALDALPLAPERAKPSAAAAARPSERPATPGEPTRSGAARITPIAAHPKFVPEAAPVDARTLEGLQALGGDEQFLTEIIEAFRLDAGQIMERIAAAVAAADGHGFAQGLVALRRAADHLGGVHLCTLTASLQHLSASELRQRGSVYVQRLDVEIERLTQALTAFATAEEESRP
jgi:hypothetical protein